VNRSPPRFRAAAGGGFPLVLEVKDDKLVGTCNTGTSAYKVEGEKTGALLTLRFSELKRLMPPSPFVQLLGGLGGGVVSSKPEWQDVAFLTQDAFEARLLIKSRNELQGYRKHTYKENIEDMAFAR